MSVYVDGTRRISTYVSSTSYTDYGADLNLPAGTRAIKVVFDNDYKSSACDRNLIVDSLSIRTATLTTTTEPVAAQPSTETSLVDTRLEAEGLKLSSTNVGVVLSDSSASGGKALKLWTNGSGSKSVAVSAPSVRLVARARGQQCSGAPNLSVYVDGTRRISTPVSTTSYA